MIIGYLRASDDKIFDREGRFVKIFEVDEGIRQEFDDVKLWLMMGWKRVSGGGGMDTDVGKLLITAWKVIYVREIHPRKKLQGGPALLPSLVDYKQAKDIRDAGLWEYLEFQLSEIDHVKFSLFGNVLFINAEGGRKVQVGIGKKPRELQDILEKYRDGYQNDE